jgi:hypothetical protein
VKSVPADGTTAQEGSPTGTPAEGATTPDGKPGDKPEDKPAEGGLNDDLPVKVGETETTVGELKEAFQLVDAAVEEVEKHKATLQNVAQWAETLRKTPADALLSFFTKEFQGDEQQAYKHVVKMAEQILQKHVEWETMSPEAREALQYKRELERMKAEVASFKSQEAKRRQEAAEKVEVQRFTQEISGALQQSGLKPTEDLISEVASVMLRDRELGLKSTAADAVVKMQKAQQKQRQELLRQLKPEELPEEIRKALLQKTAEEVRTARSAPAQTKTPKPGESKTVETTDNPVMGTSDLWGWSSFRDRK